jgi:hypothetical protein
MANETVMIGVANMGETLFEVEHVSKWVPANITYVGNFVYFSVEKTYFSMRKVDFSKIFKTT